MSAESQCDAFIAQCYGESAIIRFAQRGKRTSGTKGIPDRAYFVRGRLLWWEIKEGDDVLSVEQVKLLRRLNDAGEWVGCGGLAALQDTATGPSVDDDGYGEERALAQIALWQTRTTKPRP